jgi:hypothetical protein
LIISIALAMSLAACGGGSSGTTPTTSTAASSLSPTGIRGCAPECAAGGAEPGTIPAGEYTTQYFLDGKLTVTFDEPWQSTEDQGVEFSAWPSAAGSVNLHRVLFWSDILPVDPHGNVVTSIPNTSAGFLEWLRARPNVDVSDPQPATIGRDKLPAIVVEVAIAADADNEDPGCPSKVCVSPITWPGAGDNLYGIATPATFRLYLCDVRYGGTDHLLAVAIEAKDHAELMAFSPTAERVIASATAPLEAG